MTRIKSAVKLYSNQDPALRMVQQFEERASEKGYTSIIKEAHRYARELRTTLNLNHPEPSFRSDLDPEVEVKGQKIKQHLKRSLEDNLQEEIREEKWHGRLLDMRW